MQRGVIDTRHITTRYFPLVLPFNEALDYIENAATTTRSGRCTPRINPGDAMANIIQDGSYVLAADTEELKSFEQELESAYLVGEWQIPRRPQPDPGGVPHIWKWDFMVNMMRQAGEVLGLEEGGRRSLLLPTQAFRPRERPCRCASGFRCSGLARWHGLIVTAWVRSGLWRKEIQRLTPSSTAKSSIWRRTISF